jgi:hypothetical protein
MSDMGWSRYIRDLDNAAYAQEKAEEQDMLPHLAKHCEYDSPAEMYRVFYKYTDCGPWVSVRVHLGAPIKYVDWRGDMATLQNEGDYVWVHCGDLHRLGTWKEMAARGDIVDEILVGSIVEGADECTDEVPVRLAGIRSKRSKTHAVTQASLRSALDKAVAAVNEDAKRIWNDTHGCDTCIQHWKDLGCGEDQTAVWAECPDCGGDGEII